MTKQGGLGMRCLVAGTDVSGDVGAFSVIRGGVSVLDLTDITQCGYERAGGVRDSEIAWTSWFNPARAHPVLAALPTTAVHVMGMIATGTSPAIGDPAFAHVSRQIGYDGTRGQDGSYSFAVDTLGDSYGLEWGTLLTAGLRTDTAATNGTALDTVASATFGAQAYLQVTAFTGTDVTIKVQDSADNATFADVTGLTFTSVTAAPATQRLATAAGATVRRYLRVATTTSGGLTSATFAVAVVKNATAVTF